MMGSPKNTDSVHIMQLIQPNTVGAEIGVWEGSSSIQMARKGLKKLHLVDPYSIRGYVPASEAKDPTFNWEGYFKKYSKLTGGKSEKHFEKYYDEVYARVVKKFSKFDFVEIHRKTSTEWFDSFDGEKLDWIYIDGDHSYTEVLDDLNNFLKVLKYGAFILGAAYIWGRPVDKGGVKKAVNQFINERNLKIKKYGSNQFRINL